MPDAAQSGALAAREPVGEAVLEDRREVGVEPREQPRVPEQLERTEERTPLGRVLEVLGRGQVLLEDLARRPVVLAELLDDRALQLLDRLRDAREVGRQLA